MRSNRARVFIKISEIAKIYFQEKLKKSVNWLDWEYTEYHSF